MKLKDLMEKRELKLSEMRAINESAKGGSLEENQQKRFDVLETEVSKLNDSIDRSRRLDEFDRQIAGGETMAGDSAAREWRSNLSQYSISKAIQGELSGIELEAHTELSKNAQTRGVMVPTEIVLGESRTITTTTPVSGPAGNLVATDLAAMTDRRRPSLMIERMGATVLRNLNGNLELPRFKSSGSSGWVPEHTNATRSDAQFEKKSMAPNTVTAEYEISRRIMLQSSTAIDQVLRADISFLLSQAMDSASLKGGGTNEPTGILADSDVESITGGAFDSDVTADLIASLEVDDVTGTTAFLTNPNVMKAARKKKDADGHVIPMSNLFHEKRVESSTQVPADIGAGSDKNALIFGEWASLYLGYWSGIDILMNPYHSDVASKGGSLLHAFLDCDVLVRHPEGFRYAEID
ncbi:MAG: phage major capsid protein [Aquisalinus sp.]|nr:phage major capsid protein [Aquisalinus sp.]